MTNLESIVQQLRQERDKLDKAIAALTSLDGSKQPLRVGRRTMSAAARARISAAQKARWAKARGQKVVPIAKGKRRISAAGLARIRAAAKARGARVKRRPD